jgi:hypothetical protein
MKNHTTYYAVAIGCSTDMQGHPAPDETCEHRHRSLAEARKCQGKLIGSHREHGQTVCSAKWYNSYIVAASETTNSGWRGENI